MSNNSTARGILMSVMLVVSIVCLAAASLNICVAFHDPYFYTDAEFEARKREAFVQSYALASVAIALLVGLYRMIRRDQPTVSDSASEQSTSST
jgi:hypothetical protein